MQIMSFSTSFLNLFHIKMLLFHKPLKVFKTNFKIKHYAERENHWHVPRLICHGSHYAGPYAPGNH